MIGSDSRPISVIGQDLGLGLRSMGLTISVIELLGLGKSRDFGDASLRMDFGEVFLGKKRKISQ